MSKEKILVVDDEEDILELVRYNLAREGYMVSCATSGEEALKASLSEPVDLIILDLMLPGIDGLEVARRLRENSATRETPIVMLTAKGRSLDLTYTEFQVLYFLARRPGWVFTRSQIVDAVRGDDYPVTDRSVDVQIVGLRKKLGSLGKYIETVRGVGYRFMESQ